MQTRSRSSNSPTNSASGDDLPTRKHAFWSRAEEAKLLETLFENKKDMNHLAFKDQTFAMVVAEIAGLREKGPVKNVKMCRLKWTNICISLYMCYLYPNVYELAEEGI